MSKSILELDLEYIRSMQRQIIEFIQSVGNRLTVWIVVGNSAALLTALNYYVEPRVGPDLPGLQFAVWSFAGGLVLGFVASAVNMHTGQATSHFMNTLADVLRPAVEADLAIRRKEDLGGEVPDGDPLRLRFAEATSKKVDLKQLQRPLFRMIWTMYGLYALSAGAFFLGLMVPLSQLSARDARSTPHEVQRTSPVKPPAPAVARPTTIRP